MWKFLIYLLASTGCMIPSASALLRFSCSQLVVERLDPLVNPGVVGSPHLHQVIGGVCAYIWFEIVGNKKLTELKNRRIPSTRRWTLKLWTFQDRLLALHAPSQRISPTIGLRSCSFAREMGRINVFHKRATYILRNRTVA